MTIASRSSRCVLLTSNVGSLLRPSTSEVNRFSVLPTEQTSSRVELEEVVSLHQFMDAEAYMSSPRVVHDMASKNSNHCIFSRVTTDSEE